MPSPFGDIAYRSLAQYEERLRKQCRATSASPLRLPLAWLWPHAPFRTRQHTETDNEKATRHDHAVAAQPDRCARHAQARGRGN
eukprot:3270025-Alexandrium_andersonii.AAC.1